MDCGTAIVGKAREGESGRTGAATDGGLGLEDADLTASAGESNGCGEAIRAGTDDDGIHEESATAG